MKNYFFTLCICFTMTISAQENQQKNRTEIKLNAFSIALGTVEIEFERTINSNSSLGLSFFSTFGDFGKAFSLDYDSGFTGFYRRYFGKKYASGLFLEGFGMFHNTKRQNIFDLKRSNDLLIGLGAGYKWVSKSGIILQTNFGMGRNLFGSPENIGGRAGISIGYSF